VKVRSGANISQKEREREREGRRDALIVTKLLKELITIAIAVSLDEILKLSQSRWPLKRQKIRDRMSCAPKR
jgi:hypothetical protein